MDAETATAVSTIARELGYFGWGVATALILVIVGVVRWVVPWYLREKAAASDLLSSMAASIESHEAHVTEAVSVLTNEIRESRRITKAAYLELRALRRAIKAPNEEAREAGDD